MQVIGARRLMPLVSVVLLASCANPTPENAMLREVEFGESREIVDEKGGVRASLSLAFEQETDESGTLRLEIPMEGSEIPMYCFVWTHECELGVTTVRTSRQILSSVADEGIEISGLKTLAIESGAIGDAPYQAIVSSFLLKGDAGVGNGLMKVSAANKGGRGIACNHWDAGYSKSFSRAFKQLVESLEVAEPGPAPFHKDIYTVHLGDLSVGVSTATLRRDAEGDIEAILRSSMVLPVSDSEFLASYSRDTDWTRADGTLINAYATESDIDTETTNLALKPVDDQWRVEGLYENKEFAATLEHAQDIDSMVTDMIALRQHLTPFGSQSEAKLVRWIPSLDPSRVVDATFATSPTDELEVLMKVGSIEMNAVRDAQGLIERATFKIGANEVTQKRVYLHAE